MRNAHRKRHVCSGGQSGFYLSRGYRERDATESKPSSVNTGAASRTRDTLVSALREE